MSLDLFASNIDDAVNYAARTSGAELPSTFSDNFNDAWNKGYLVNQSISGEIRKTRARSDIVDEAVAKTGDQSFQQSGEGGGFDTAAFNAKVAQHKAAKPDLELNPISDEAVQARADEIGVRQLADSAHMAGRERTTGGAIGSFLGTAAGALSDPVNLIAFPLAAPESLGVLGTALAWGAIGAGSQTAIEALNAPAMERIQPGYSTSGQPVTNVLESALGGAVLGGGLKGLSSAWQRVKTGEWPRTVRDAGNVVESEAQIASTNPLPGVDGEAAHRTALNKAIDDIANNRPVDVDGIVPPELVQHIDAYHGSPHDFERFDVSKIGTGEGVQAYGHGLYFAENPKVAGQYATMSPITATGAEDLARQTFHQYDGDRAAATEALRGFADRQIDPRREAMQRAAIAVLESDTPIARPNVYSVRITAKKEHMLDLDTPLNQQPPQVQDAVKRAMGIDYHGNFDPAKSERMWAQFQSADGKTAVRQGFIASDDKLAAQRLADAGIPGLKYLDEGSRGEGSGTRNFVIFNDKDVSITHKNGKPVNAEIRQNVVDQAAGLPPKQPELGLTPPEPAKPAGPNVEAVKALDAELTPAKIEEARVHPDMEDTISRDLDRLMLERPGLEVPTGVTVDAEGKTVPTTRTVESVVAEADARLAAAKEIEACVGPLQTAERAA